MKAFATINVFDSDEPEDCILFITQRKDTLVVALLSRLVLFILVG